MSRAALALVRVVTPPPPTDSDAQLLRAFLDARSEVAFAELVRRHGPMVLATCRRVLSNAADADDAFQATFLVLARKAHVIRGANVAGWLYGVAVRTARGVRLMRDRRLKRETRAARTDVARPPAEPRDADAAALIDAELARLPAHQREALVLCELQGLSRKAAAEELGIAEGTLSSRLAAAKRKLAGRLSARGWRALTVGPVAVPVALASATAALARGAAHATVPASAAAAVVLKGMLFEQLRAGALACAVLLATVCGGFAMTGAPASDPLPTPAPLGAAADPAADLVKQLGSEDFAKRVAAEKELRKLGTTAEPALRAGAKSDDPEVRARSLTVLNQIRVDQRQAFAARKADLPGAAWKRFKELVGDTEASRKLFLEMTADERRAATIERAEANPEKAAEVYAAEVARVVDLSDKSFAQFVGQPARVPGPGPDPIAVASREAVSLGDSVSVLFLGTRALPTGAKDPKATRALLASFSDGLNGPLEAPLRKLFVAWLDKRRDAALVRDGLETALFARVPEVLPIARRHAADAKLAPAAKGWALLAVGNYGTLDDLPLLTASKDDTRAYYGYDTIDKKRYEIQVREAAAAMSLLLRGQDFEKYGFERTDWQVWWIRTNPAPFKSLHWCETDKGRDAALKAAWEWLDKQPKVEPKRADPKPDPCATLVERLGSNDFATREAAEKALRALGAKAESALRIGAKSDDPEVRARCTKLLVAVRKDALAELVRTFDATKDAPSAHPIWKRFADTAGNTPASRALFARLLRHPAWLARLDAAETGPDEARRQYREALRAVADTVSANLRVFFVIYVWPCDTPDQTAFLLFLGSYPGTDGPLPKASEFAGLADAEARVTYARGLQLALEGKEIAPGPNNKYDATAALPEGSAKAFAKLLAAWLPRRAEPSPLFHGFELALASGATDVLPAARTIAADAERPVASRVAALAAVSQFGEASDLKLFAPLFDDNTQLVIPPPPQNGDPGPRSRRLVVADRAIGLALLLADRDPANFGFEHAKGKFRRANGRPVVNAYEFEEFGFNTDEARAAAHKKAKAVLTEKQPKVDPVAQRAALDALVKGFDPAGTAEPDHPVWARFKAVAGASKEARALFAEVLADARLARLLDAAEADPAARARLYRDEAANVSCAAHYAYAGEVIGGYRLIEQGPKADELKPPVASLRAADFAALFQLGGYAEAAVEATGKDRAGRAVREALFVETRAFRAATQSAPMRALFAAWLDRRTNGDALESAYWRATAEKLTEAVPAARRLIAAEKAPAPAKAYAALYLGRCGDRSDAARVARLFDVDTVARAVIYDKPAPVQVRDAALAAALLLCDENPADYGFDVLKLRGGRKAEAYDMAWLGFFSDESRAAAHKKAKAVLANKLPKQ